MTFRGIRFASCIALSLILVASVATQAADNESAPDPRLSGEERARLIELFEASRNATEAFAAQASGERWSEKPAEDRWSVGEVVEHIALAEEALFGLVQGALQGEPADDWQSLAATGIDGVLTALSDRSKKFQAPPNLAPTGEVSREEVLARYAAARVKTLDFVRSTDLPVKQHTATGPPGTMNVHQWLALLAAHNQRHNQQIEEVLEQTGG